MADKKKLLIYGNTRYYHAGKVYNFVADGIERVENIERVSTGRCGTYA